MSDIQTITKYLKALSGENQSQYTIEKLNIIFRKKEDYCLPTSSIIRFLNDICDVYEVKKPLEFFDVETYLIEMELNLVYKVEEKEIYHNIPPLIYYN